MSEAPDRQIGTGGKLRDFVHEAAYSRRYRVVNILG